MKQKPCLIKTVFFMYINFNCIFRIFQEEPKTPELKTWQGEKTLARTVSHQRSDEKWNILVVNNRWHHFEKCYQLRKFEGLEM